MGTITTMGTITGPGTCGAERAMMAVTRSPSRSRSSCQLPFRGAHGRYCTKQVSMCRPAGASVESTLEATTQSTQRSSATSPRRVAA